MRENNINKIEVHVACDCFYKGKVLVVKRSQERRLYPGLWECGGGQVYPGENFEDAVKRQSKEELGIIATPLKVLGTYQISTVDLSQKKIPGIKFICNIDSFINGKCPTLSKEHSEFRFLSREEVKGSDLGFIPGIKEEIEQAFIEMQKQK